MFCILCEILFMMVYTFANTHQIVCLKVYISVYVNLLYLKENKSKKWNLGFVLAHTDWTNKTTFFMCGIWLTQCLCPSHN